MTVNAKTAKKRNVSADLMRSFFCIAVLLYHMNLLPGGYLAVCSFFVMSGYLLCRSLQRKHEVKLGVYYLSRLKRIYLPLVFTVLMTVAVSLLFKEIVWVSRRPESLSVLLGYNNFWQLHANQDYFAAHASSPFMHFWYTGILVQFTLVFPLLAVLLKRYARHYMKMVLDVLCTASIIGFVFFCLYADVMTIYYNTLSRLFSLMVGVSFCIHRYDVSVFCKRMHISREMRRWFIYGALCFLAVLFVMIPSASPWMPAMMIFTTMLTALIMAFSWSVQTEMPAWADRTVGMISDHSYEIYLVQYPVIYYLGYLMHQRSAVLQMIMTVILTMVLAVFVHQVSSQLPRTSIQKVLAAAAVIVCLGGVGALALGKDMTQEMQALEAELNSREEDMIAAQEAYAQKMQEMLARQEKLDLQFEERDQDISRRLEEVEKKLQSLNADIASMPLTAIGDSVLLSASGRMYDTFSSLYCDAKVSRTAWSAKGILDDLISRGILADTVLFNFGANGNPPEDVMMEMLDTCGSRMILLVTVTNDSSVHVNDDMKRWAKDRDNVYIVDWESASKGHPEYFVADGLHMQPDGQLAYAECVFNTLHALRLKRLEDQKASLQNAMKFTY